METIYRVTHNVEELKHGENYTESRYFTNIEGAKVIFNLIRRKVDFNRDEFAALDAIKVKTTGYGEITHEYTTPLSYWSDDTKCGAEYYENV